MITAVCLIITAIFVGCLIIVNIWARREWRRLSEAEQQAADEQAKRDIAIW